MKATELRIGNLVYFEINGKLEVHSIVPKDIHVMHICESQFNIECAQYKPIPSTEEWLLKAGFVEEFENEFYNGIFLIKVFENECLLYLGDFIELPIKYVHQLQNLYFELTGNELTIKL